MNTIIKGAEYTLGGLVTHHAMMALELQDRQEDQRLAVGIMVQIVSESLCHGMEKTYYDEITPEQLAKYSKLLTTNLTLPEITKLFTALMVDMNSGSDSEGKPKA